MIFMIPADPQQMGAETREILVMYFPLLPFCARISIQHSDTRSPSLIPAAMNAHLSGFMKIRHNLLLDFRKDIPHITARFHR